MSALPGPVTREVTPRIARWVVAGLALVYWRRLIGKADGHEESMQAFLNGAALALALAIVRFSHAK